jgi:DNA modification methylase
VIDPFAGSDTTGVACRELNLKYDTCEVDPKMYTTGVHRHKQGGLFE